MNDNQCDRCGGLAESKFGPNYENMRLCPLCRSDWTYSANSQLNFNFSSEDFKRAYKAFTLTKRGAQ